MICDFYTNSNILHNVKKEKSLLIPPPEMTAVDSLLSLYASIFFFSGKFVCTF